jgi:putative transcriptional regulator
MGRIRLRIDEIIKARELRDGRQLTTAEIARGTGISPESLTTLVENRVERVALDDLTKLCDYFGCTPGELLHYEADPAMFDEEEVESRDIVARWERTFGADEHLPT